MATIQKVSDLIPQQSPKNNKKGVYFGSATSISTYWIRKQAEDLIVKDLPYSTRLIYKLGKIEGEAKNIIVNSLGTAFIAPIFMVHNPFSKEDKKTREYTAWRQPISAILAVATQLAFVIPFDSLINNMANKGELGPLYDLSIRPSNKYIRKQIRKENKNISKSDLEAKMTDLASSKFNAAVTEAQQGKIAGLSDADFITKMKKTAQAMIKEVDEQIDDIEQNGLHHQRKRAVFISENPNMVNEYLKKVQTIQGHFTTVNNEVDTKGIFKELKQIANQYTLDKKPNPEMLNIMEETAKCRNIARLNEKVLGIGDKISKFMGLSEEQIDKILRDDIAQQAKELFDKKELIKKILKEINSDKPLNETIAAIKKTLTDKLPNRDFFREIIKKHLSDVQSNIRGFKEITGLCVSFVVVPLTCYSLNWVYPKIMNRFFPELSEAKAKSKAKGEAK